MEVKRRLNFCEMSDKVEVMLETCTPFFPPAILVFFLTVVKPNDSKLFDGNSVHMLQSGEHVNLYYVHLPRRCATVVKPNVSRRVWVLLMTLST